jgi:hypothetical protein
MLERKFIKPNVFRITQTTMSFTDTKVQEVFYARYEGKWNRITDDKLETAMAVAKCGYSKYARELTQGEVTDLKTRHLDHSENSEGSLKW